MCGADGVLGGCDPYPRPKRALVTPPSLRHQFDDNETLVEEALEAMLEVRSFSLLERGIESKEGRGKGAREERWREGLRARKREREGREEVRERERERENVSVGE